MLKMSTLSAANEKQNHSVNGRWVWKDDTKSLDFIGRNADRKLNPVTAPVSTLPLMMEKKAGVVGISTIAHLMVHKHAMVSFRKADSSVKLSHIKSVVLDALTEKEGPIHSAFLAYYSSEQCDALLVSLQQHFHWFFQRVDVEEQQANMPVPPGAAEKQELIEIEANLEKSLKRVGETYATIILGLGMSKQHHMDCGRSRVSSTHRDRTTFELLYLFCANVINVTFRRRDSEAIGVEIGKILRSDMFNPALRVSREGTVFPSNTQTEHIKSCTATVKRASVKTIMYQKSPALRSLLPSSKEQAPWLFHTRFLHGQPGLEKRFTSSMHDDDDGDNSTYIIPDKIGIVGEPLSLFHSSTLSPIDAESENNGEPTSE